MFHEGHWLLMFTFDLQIRFAYFILSYSTDMYHSLLLLHSVIIFIFAVLFLSVYLFVRIHILIKSITHNSQQTIFCTSVLSWHMLWSSLVKLLMKRIMCVCVWQRERECIFEGCITVCHNPYPLHIIVLKLIAYILLEHDDNKINVSKNSLL